MTKLRELTVQEVADILSKGTFTELISTVEHAQFECKNQLYDTKTSKSKIELAKDISALANTNGGYLLIGPQTKKSPLHQGDEVVSVSEFPSSKFEADTYRNILSSFIYPPITDLKIEWHPSGADPAKGIASILVPRKSEDDKPFIVMQSDIDSQVRGHIFGFFQRVGDDVLPTTAQMIRDTLKDGKRYGDLARRMENIESLIVKLGSVRSEKTPPSHERVRQRDLLRRRAGEAKVAVQLLDAPSFFMIATPTEPTRLNELFSSKSPEYKAINDPPTYRENGFDLDPHNPVLLVRGELIRRVAISRKGLELWQDGTLIFVGRNDEDFLGWAVRKKPSEHNIYINNYVLTEVVSLFFVLAIQIFKATQAPPEKIAVCFEFVREQQAEDATYELSGHPIDRIVGSFPGHKIRADNKAFWIEFTMKDPVPEVEALRLLKEIYHWFEIKDDDIPYVDRKATPERVDRASYV